ncbi:MAG TPA: hypothetical protein VJX74_20705 [Blastocatellia bacterium]|nr:hypothetical protein [Blastocatellia bacterium]
MLAINKKLSALTLGLVIMFAAVVPANAQRWRNRDRLSTGQKAAIIGGGAAAGALLGGLLGGKKGAVIGGLLGGGGGTGVVIYKDRRDNDRYYGYRNYRGYRDNNRFGRFYRNRR